MAVHLVSESTKSLHMVSTVLDVADDEAKLRHVPKVPEGEHAGQDRLHLAVPGEDVHGEGPPGDELALFHRRPQGEDCEGGAGLHLGIHLKRLQDDADVPVLRLRLQGLQVKAAVGVVAVEKYDPGPHKVELQPLEVLLLGDRLGGQHLPGQIEDDDCIHRSIALMAGDHTYQQACKRDFYEDDSFCYSQR